MDVGFSCSTLLCWDYDAGARTITLITVHFSMLIARSTFESDAFSFLSISHFRSLASGWAMKNEDVSEGSRELVDLSAEVGLGTRHVTVASGNDNRC